MPPGQTTFDDRVRGTITFDNTNIEDFVILRSDRQPTYHLSVVADDVGRRREDAGVRLDDTGLGRYGLVRVARVGPLEDAAASLERYVMGMFPDGVRVERALVSGDEILDH